MVMLDVLYGSTPLLVLFPSKQTCRQVHCGPRVDLWATGLNLVSLPESEAIKSASEKGSGVCRETVAGTRLPQWN